MNIELHENLMRVTVDTFKRETDKLKEKALYWESQYRASENTITSMRNLMRFTADTFKRETDKLKAELACVKSGHELETRLMRDALMGNGFTQMVTGTWQPPLGKRHDVAGQSLIDAAMAHVDAERNLFDAANKYKARPK